MDRTLVLIGRAHQGDKAARDLLFEENTGLIYSVAKRFLGLFVGCIIANLLGGAIPVDIIFGSIATLIGAFFTYKLRNTGKWTAPIPPIVSNIVIVPLVLRYGYGINLPIPFMMLTVGAGEFISAGVIGMILLGALSKYKNVLFHKKAAV